MSKHNMEELMASQAKKNKSIKLTRYICTGIVTVIIMLRYSFIVEIDDNNKKLIVDIKNRIYAKVKQAKFWYSIVFIMVILVVFVALQHFPYATCVLSIIMFMLYLIFRSNMDKVLKLVSLSNALSPVDTTLKIALIGLGTMFLSNAIAFSGQKYIRRLPDMAATFIVSVLLLISIHYLVYLITALAFNTNTFSGNKVGKHLGYIWMFNINNLTTNLPLTILVSVLINIALFIVIYYSNYIIFKKETLHTNLFANVNCYGYSKKDSYAYKENVQVPNYILI